MIFGTGEEKLAEQESEKKLDDNSSISSGSEDGGDGMSDDDDDDDDDTSLVQESEFKDNVEHQIAFDEAKKYRQLQKIDAHLARKTMGSHFFNFPKTFIF